MPRVKGGATTRRRRKKILKLAKGYFGSKRALYRTAHEQVMRSLAYAYRDRKQRKREFRKLWITRINAAAKLNGMKYSKLIHGLALANVQVNRKMLADIAVNQPEDFKAYCALAQAALDGYIPPKTENKVEVKKEAPKAKKETPKEAPKAKEEAPKKEKVDYSSMLVTELKELCSERNITGYSTMRKAELIEALEESDK
ncbi:50S ribosomal protein L20 [Tenericutes bacterium MZ-XQ]|jgi:large subunit ribosomal protein L20|nr:50S ribosomal protein L20 [Tenericutes bacterium MZ-XQ]